MDLLDSLDFIESVHVGSNEMINLGLPPDSSAGADFDGLREGSVASTGPHRAFPKLGNVDYVLNAKEAVLYLLMTHGFDNLLLKD